jgi:N-methylhydantoinase B/oxoprolinase/acetone carboxylase alpha subunit
VIAGDTIVVRTPGGGGYGDPWQFGKDGGISN